MHLVREEAPLGLVRTKYVRKVNGIMVFSKKKLISLPRTAAPCAVTNKPPVTRFT